MSDPLNIVTIRDIAQTGSNVHPGIASRNLLLLALCDEVERAQTLLTRLRQEWSEVGDGCLIVKHYDDCKGCQLLDDVIGEDR